MPASFRSASSTSSGPTSFTCPAPGGIVNGNVLLLCHAATAGTLAEMSTPTGGATWNLLASSEWPGSPAGAQAGMRLWWKVASGEPASYSLTPTGGGDNTVSVVCVQDALSGTPVVAFVGDSVSSAIVATPSTTPNGVDDFEVRFVGGRATGSSYTPPAGFTERTDLVSGTSAAQSSATRPLTGNGATGVHNFTSATNMPRYLGFTVNIASAPGPTFIGWGIPL